MGTVHFSQGHPKRALHPAAWERWLDRAADRDGAADRDAVR